MSERFDPDVEQAVTRLGRELDGLEYLPGIIARVTSHVAKNGTPYLRLAIRHPEEDRTCTAQAFGAWPELERAEGCEATLEQDPKRGWITVHAVWEIRELAEA